MTVQHPPAHPPGPGYAPAPGYAQPGYAPAPGYAPQWTAPGASFAPARRPRSPRGLGTAAAVLLGCQAGLYVAGAVAAAWAVLSWSRLSGASGAILLPPERVWFVLLVVTAMFSVAVNAALISWLYVTASNARTAGADLRYSPAWAIAGWFVPVLNLWRPKQVFDDVWRASIPGVPPGTDLDRLPRPAVVTGWWAAFQVAQVLPFVGFLFAIYPAVVPNPVQALWDRAPLLGPVDVASFHETFALWIMWSHVLLAVSAILATSAVGRVTSWQHQRMTADASPS